MTREHALTHGRTLAYRWREGGMLMVNEQLVAEGYALTLTIPPNVRYSEQFSNAARVARENGLGLRSPCADQSQEATDDAPVLDDAASPTDQPARLPAPQPKPEEKPAGDCLDS